MCFRSYATMAISKTDPDGMATWEKRLIEKNPTVAHYED